MIDRKYLEAISYAQDRGELERIETQFFREVGDMEATLTLCERADTRAGRLPYTPLQLTVNEEGVLGPYAYDGKVQRAISLAKQYHQGQKRYGGEDYYEHHLLPVATLTSHSTSGYAMAGRLNIDCVCVALLHDILEDTECSYDHLLNKMGPRVAYGVELLSKEVVGNHRARHLATCIKIANAPWWVRIIKVMDIMNNAKTMYRDNPNYAPQWFTEKQEMLDGLVEGLPLMLREALTTIVTVGAQLTKK